MKRFTPSENFTNFGPQTPNTVISPTLRTFCFIARLCAQRSANGTQPNFAKQVAYDGPLQFPGISWTWYLIQRVKIPSYLPSLRKWSLWLRCQPHKANVNETTEIKSLVSRGPKDFKLPTALRRSIWSGNIIAPFLFLSVQLLASVMTSKVGSGHFIRPPDRYVDGLIFYQCFFFLSFFFLSSFFAT